MTTRSLARSHSHARTLGAHTRTLVRRHARMHDACALARMHTCTCTCNGSTVATLAHTPARAHSRVDARMCTHAARSTHSRAACTHAAHLHAACTYAHARTHAARIHTQARTHAHKRAHGQVAHTHTQHVAHTRTNAAHAHVRAPEFSKHTPAHSCTPFIYAADICAAVISAASMPSRRIIIFTLVC